MHESVAGIIFSKNRTQVLLIKRKDVPVWVLPGGGIERGESPECAIIREMQEETGLNVAIEKKIAEYIPINRLAKFTHFFECSVLTGKLELTNETSGIKYFDLTALPKMPPPYHEWIQDSLANLSSPLRRELLEVTYKKLFFLLLLHPILVMRFLLSKIGLRINT